jgi:hypothetical protein
MNDEMASLGRMVDEVLSGVDTAPDMTTTPADGSCAAPAEGHSTRVLGGGALHQAVEDVCWIYRNRYLAENLRRFGWRKARRKVMSQGPLEAEWVSTLVGSRSVSRAAGWR